MSKVLRIILCYCIPYTHWWAHLRIQNLPKISESKLEIRLVTLKKIDKHDNQISKVMKLCLYKVGKKIIFFRRMSVNWNRWTKSFQKFTCIPCSDTLCKIYCPSFHLLFLDYVFFFNLQEHECHITKISHLIDERLKSYSLWTMLVLSWEDNFIVLNWAVVKTIIFDLWRL